MSNNNDDIRAKVEARRQAEARNSEAMDKPGQKAKPTAVLKMEIPDTEIEGYLNENRVGDAKLYTRLHRGKVIYVNNWAKFLTWAGHHWEEDHYNVHARLISDVCDLYERYAEAKQQEADEETDKDIKAALKTLADGAIRRVNLLRDIPGQDKLAAGKNTNYKLLQHQRFHVSGGSPRIRLRKDSSRGKTAMGRDDREIPPFIQKPESCVSAGGHTA